MRKILGIKFLAAVYLMLPSILHSQTPLDTSYVSIAPVSIQRLVAPGKAPVVTLQVSGFYNIGLADMAGNDNAAFSKQDFVNGKDFGTRYGYGVGLTGKISLHKEGHLRLLVSTLFNRFESDFVISKTPGGKVSYNVFSGGLGLENNFTPDRKFKYSVGFEIVGSLINGKASLDTNSTSIDLTIKNAFRIGLSGTVGFEYAFTNSFGFNLGMKLTHANILLTESKESSSSTEIYLNDAKPSTPIPYAGWKQFFYTSFYTGFNFYFGMKNKN